MKKFRNLNMEVSEKLIFCSILLLMFFVFGCTLQDEEPIIMEDETTTDGRMSSDAAAKISDILKNNNGIPIQLSGTQNYYTYATVNNEVLQDLNIECDVTLEFQEGQNISIIITEYTVPPRTSVLFGKMTPSGQMKFAFPTPLATLPDGSELYITDIIMGHSGCTLSGPGINKGTLNYKGSFDGERLLATAPFNMKCEVYWEPNDIFDTPVEGPVQMKWTIDVTMD